VQECKGFYRRYSDDIMIICKPEQKLEILEFIERSIKESHVEISRAKTEEYLFKELKISSKVTRLSCIHIGEHCCTIDKPLTYLGFEFHGYKTLLKSANIAKFYRRMIFSVKIKARRAKKIQNNNETDRPVIFRRRLQRKYSQLDLRKSKEIKQRVRLRKDIDSLFGFEKYEPKKTYNTNYFSYIEKASLILDESAIKNQLRKHKTIFNQALHRHLDEDTKSQDY
jgi:uncharacterized protein YqgV (UPF0045/DUF77 family)